MQLPNLIYDLALILIVGGATTILFKWIRQPLVLGYIVAGFLISPYFPVLPTVLDYDSIHIWSEIGIICLMFSLGLEFSIKKLVNVGGTAIITSVTEVTGMFLFGFLTGSLLGWETMDSVILGGILAMSSTTIIIKAFEELNLMKEKFTSIVFGALIVEDIIGIFLMVCMSTFALGAGGSGVDLLFTILRLLLYLAILLLFGIFAIPTFLKRVRNFMNDETTMIVSLAICFGLVLLFAYIGFSTALGSFIAGSILAGTVFSEKIEHLVKPVKDLFGAVFFISVGMLVDPAVLVSFAVPIIVITIATIVGKLLFSTLGVLFSGQKLETSVRAGASLAQIGEFAFIIAALGMSLNLISGFMYPVVVSVSVITTFTTPFFIKKSDGIYRFVKKVLPDKLLNKIENFTSEKQSEEEKSGPWGLFIKNYCIGMAVEIVLCIGIMQFGIHIVEPFFERFMPHLGGQILTSVILMLCLAPILAVSLYRRDKNFSILIIQNKSNRFPLYAFLIFKVAVSVIVITYTISRFLGVSILWLIIPTILFIVLISRSDWIIGNYLEIEARFLTNFNEKNLQENNGAHELISGRLWVAEYTVEKGCDIIGREIRSLEWGSLYRVSIIKVISSKKHINIPEDSYKPHRGDIIHISGTRDQIDVFEVAAEKRHVSLIKKTEPVTLRDFIQSEENEHDSNKFFVYAITIGKESSYSGKNVKDLMIRREFHCDIIGVERGGYPVINPDVNFIINNGDMIWLLGGYRMVGGLIAKGLIEADN